MKYSEKHDTTWNILLSITFSQLYISCYIAENRFPLGQCTIIFNIHNIHWVSNIFFTKSLGVRDSWSIITQPNACILVRLNIRAFFSGGFVKGLFVAGTYCSSTVIHSRTAVRQPQLKSKVYETGTDGTGADPEFKKNTFTRVVC